MRFESGGIGCNGEADNLGRPTKGQIEIFATIGRGPDSAVVELAPGPTRRRTAQPLLTRLLRKAVPVLYDH